MAVLQLAGPVSLIGSNGQAVLAQGTGTAYSDLRWVQWVPGVGLVACLQGYLALVALDGRVRFAADSFVYYQEPGFWSYVVASGGLRVSQGKASSYYNFLREPQAFCALANVDPFGNWCLPPGCSTAVDFLDRRLTVGPDGFVYNGSPAVGLHLINTTLSYTQDTDQPVMLGSVTTVGLGRSSNEMFIASNSDLTNLGFRFYDTRTRTMTPISHLGVPGTAAVFASDLGVVVSIHGTGTASSPYTLRVWSLDVVPTGLSPVTPIAQSVQNTGFAAYQVQVQGANGDWVQGKRVSWTLTGPGRLIDAQSVSNVNGFAVCRVFFRPTETGTFKLQAQVLC